MRKQMNKFLKTIIIFVPFAILLYLILIIVWGGFVPQRLRKNLLSPQGLGFTYERLQDVKRKQNVDILILGSSRAYREFDTRIFGHAGYNCFNLGSSSQTPQQTLLLLNRYLKKLNPSIILFEVSPDSFSLDGIESSMDIIANDENVMSSLKLVLGYNNIKLYNTFFYSAYWHSLSRLEIHWGIDTHQKKTYAKLKGTDTYIEGGYVEKENICFKHMQYEKQKWDYREEQFEAFNEIIKMIYDQNENIRLVLIQTPITQSLYHSYTNNRYFDSIMIQQKEYYNFNEMLQLDDSLYFYDAQHLNQDGVSIFNKMILSDILCK